MGKIKLSFPTLDSDPLTIIMLELVRSAVLNHSPAIPKDVVINWDTLMSLAHKEGVLAFVWDGICQLPPEQKPSRTFLINYGLSALGIRYHYEYCKSLLVEMVKVCNDNGIKLLLLKGVGVAQYYPIPSSREFGDIDIYLNGAFEMGNKLFAPSQYHESKKHSSFSYRGIEVENHKVMINSNCRQNKKIELFLEKEALSAQIQAGGYYTLPPFANIVFLMMHSIHHLCSEYKLSLRNLLDLVVVINANRDIVKSQEWSDTLINLGIDKHYELLLYLIEWRLRMDMIQFHLFEFDDGEKQVAYDTLVRNPQLNSIPFGLPFFVQLKLYLNRQRRMRWLIKYESTPFYARWYHVFFIQIYIVAKKVLGLPEHGSFKQSFRKKYGKSKDK